MNDRPTHVARDDEGYAVPLAMADCAIFALREARLHLLLPVRTRNLEAGKRALVGGRLHLDEDDSPLAAARRIAREKLGIDVRYMEQLYTFGGPYRDAGWTVTVAYIAIVQLEQIPLDLRYDLFPVDDLPPLAFDHDDIARMAVARMRDKARYSSLPAYLLPPEFTIEELRRVYAQVTGNSLTKSTFREQVSRQGFVEPTGRTSAGYNHRPAELWRLSSTGIVNFDATLADAAKRKKAATRER
jgi:8-oxo-dGTP diphosphatase